MLKPDAKALNIKEQFLTDEITGLMLIFRVAPDGTARLRIVGSILPFGNRDFQFDSNGELAGMGTNCADCHN